MSQEHCLSSARTTLERWRARLLKTSGCTGVALGHKVHRGRPTRDLAAVVFVARKDRTVSSRAAVPRAIDGLPTDVVERTFRVTLAATDPYARFDQLFSGISIATATIPAERGTIGCFFRTTGNAPEGVDAGEYLLTCQHVVRLADPRNRNSESRVVIQPRSDMLTVPESFYCGDYVQGYQDDSFDCAIVKVGYGRTYENEIPNYPWYPGRRDLRGIGQAAPGDEVYKYGATTRFTKGVVRYTDHSPAGQPATYNHVIVIETQDQSVWAAPGDSGSITVRQSDDYVLGLNFATDARTVLNPQPRNLPAYPAASGGFAYDIQAQMMKFAARGGAVRLA